VPCSRSCADAGTSIRARYATSLATLRNDKGIERGTAPVPAEHPPSSAVQPGVSDPNHNVAFIAGTDQLARDVREVPAVSAEAGGGRPGSRSEGARPLEAMRISPS